MDMINLPGAKDWVKNPQYLTMMGSHAYGVATLESDIDLVGFCIPRLGIIFPHVDGVVQGFGNQGERFDQYQQHHLEEYDVTIYNIVKYFQLLMQNNPNIIDSIFTPQHCIKVCTPIGQMVRENRKIFLHRGAWHGFKGYAYSQITNMKNKNPVGKRKEDVEKYGMDVKYAYHMVRLLDEIEQILSTGDLELGRNKEQLKAIREGLVPVEDIYRHFDEKKDFLEKLYEESTLPWGPDEDKIKQLLMQCLEHHYGSLDKVVKKDSSGLLNDLRALVERYE